MEEILKSIPQTWGFGAYVVLFLTVLVSKYFDIKRENKRHEETKENISQVQENILSLSSLNEKITLIREELVTVNANSIKRRDELKEMIDEGISNGDKLKLDSNEKIIELTQRVMENSSIIRENAETQRQYSTDLYERATKTDEEIKRDIYGTNLLLKILHTPVEKMRPSDIELLKEGCNKYIKDGGNGLLKHYYDMLLMDLDDYNKTVKPVTQVQMQKGKKSKNNQNNQNNVQV